MPEATAPAGNALRAAERRGRPAMLAAIGGAALLLGLLVYVTDRGYAPPALMQTLPALAGSHWFGALGQWLPSFVHTLAFSLFTAAALPIAATPRYGVCIAWAMVNILFEVGQHPRISPSLAAWLQGGLGDRSITRMLSSYFVRGTFDWGDILATVAGALAAGAVLRFMSRHMEHPHAK